ncbi:MAG: bifunctional (p)ppGpp synthetase/guanosine-3',5'-bis(diphosphate) 3'-pyrophosphohydrolase [Bacillota bacterium]|nr:bifunctional (p)ppGpp synthetase/guanosine-3',5'-bis(diphosphate) 3'-pyrophosphohydrolase [Bacillota bacterium]
MAITIDDIIQKAKTYNTSSNSDLIREAYTFAEKQHEGQMRDSGESYISHPLTVAHILASLQIDDDTIIAGLLHDLVEDTAVTLEQVEEMFGAQVRRLVHGVTKLSKLEFRNRHEAQAENLRRMFMAMSSDIRIILIKLADRLHNMRTIHSHRSLLRQKEIAEETLYIYAPLAHRLGIFKIKSELEDLSIEVLEPEAVAQIREELEEEKEDRDRLINRHIDQIKTALEEAGIKPEVNGRIKSYYSIYNKMQRQRKELSEIFDLNAIRIIVDTVRECYESLGIIHTMWKPIPGRFKDYIAMPKQNMYQSIHTTLIDSNGTPFEVQIRTWDMHRIAEYGIAAHWRYKEGKSADADFDKKVEWLRQMLEWQQDVGDAREFMETVKGDLFNDNIYVFSPQGDVYELPRGSIPLDFAYRVHTQVGHQCVGAKLNHRLVPLDTPLNNGDIVEILTAKGRGPSRDWLNICRTQQAKNRIRQWFRKEKREENIALGTEMLERELRKLNLDPSSILKENLPQDIARRYGCNNLEDVFAGIGDGAIRAETIATKYRDEYQKEQAPTIEIKAEEIHSNQSTSILVEGLDDPMVRLAACCKPMPGEKIIGYVTRGRGISVHHQDCPNAKRYFQTEPERIINVSWGNVNVGSYQVELEVVCEDRERLLMDILAIMAETKTPVNGAHANVDRRNKYCSIFIKIEVKSMEQLDYLMQRLQRIKDVQEVRRLANRNRKGEE